MNKHYLLLCAVGLLLVAPAPSLAGPILPGYDYLTTPLGTATLDLTPYGGPVVPLKSRGIQGTTTDTIVQRIGSLPPGPGGVGPIPVEIVALSLQSVAPVALFTSFFDVFVEIDAGGVWGLSPAPNPTPPSTGVLTVTSHVEPGGGTFDSFFDVFADIVLIETVFPFTTIHQPAPPVHITSTGSTWSHAAATDPSMGGFAPAGPIFHTGPHPQTNPAQGPFPEPIPEPSSLVLGVLAALGLGLMAIRKGWISRAA